MELIVRSEGNYLAPPDAEIQGFVLCIPGSTKSNYLGFGTLARTPDALVLTTPIGVEAIVPIEGIEDVTVCKFEGIVIERNTSVGPMLSPLPYPHGIEIVYTEEIRIMLRLRLLTLSANAANAWAADIRQAARDVQQAALSKAMPIKIKPNRS